MTNHNPNPNNKHNNNHNKLIHHHKNRHLPPLPTARSNSTIQACAACRYQRRKCAPDCILAPYFPHERQRQFQNAHKLFGVSNITKIIRNLDRQQKDEAMRTIIYQSDVRAQDPVGGCFRIIRELHRQIEISRNELELVLQHLALCRTLAVQNQTQNNQSFNHDQIIIDEIDYDIHLVNNPEESNFDDSSGHRQNHELDHLQNVTLEPHDQQDQEQFVSNKLQDGILEINNAVAPEQSWTAVHNSPPANQTLHASVCDDFKLLLINDITQGDKTEIKEINEPSEETLFSEENNKGLIKEESLCYYNEEEYGVKNAAFGTLTDCKAIQVEGE